MPFTPRKLRQRNRRVCVARLLIRSCSDRAVGVSSRRSSIPVLSTRGVSVERVWVESKTGEESCRVFRVPNDLAMRRSSVPPANHVGCISRMIRRTAASPGYQPQAVRQLQLHKRSYLYPETLQPCRLPRLAAWQPASLFYAFLLVGKQRNLQRRGALFWFASRSRDHRRSRTCLCQCPSAFGTCGTFVAGQTRQTDRNGNPPSRHVQPTRAIMGSQAAQGA